MSIAKAISVVAGTDRYAVIHGENTNVLAALGAEGCLFDHTITDPPYSEQIHDNAKARSTILNQANGRPVTRARRGVLAFEPLRAEDVPGYAAAMRAVTLEWCLVFSDIESNVLWRTNLTAKKFEHVRVLVWIREGCTPQFTGDRPAQAFEAIELSHAGTRPKRWNERGKRGLYAHPIVQRRGAKFDVQHRGDTPKPIELMLELVADFTRPNDVILDPFGGYGTTAVAALRLGRRVVMIERDVEAARCAEEWCAAEVDNLSPVARKHGQRSLLTYDRNEDGIEVVK